MSSDRKGLALLSRAGLRTGSHITFDVNLVALVVGASIAHDEYSLLERTALSCGVIRHFDLAFLAGHDGLLGKFRHCAAAGGAGSGDDERCLTRVLELEDVFRILLVGQLTEVVGLAADEVELGRILIHRLSLGWAVALSEGAGSCEGRKGESEHYFFHVCYYLVVWFRYFFERQVANVCSLKRNS